METVIASGAGAPWADRPTTKQRTAVQHAVDRLLDDLAPERAPPRFEATPAALLRHRTPRGCIVQAAAGAVSVSWFPSSTVDLTFGELQIIAWRGTVSRPGSARRADVGAEAVRQVVLRPVEIDPGAWGWRSEGDDAVVYDGKALAAYCHAMVEQQAAA